MSDAAPDKMRLDKWLWAARFFKTRQLAAEAVNGGKVHLNGQRSKPGKDIKPGSRLKISKGPYDWDIEVRILPKQRRPASEACEFYVETGQSHARRQQLNEQIRAERAVTRSTEHRPNKKERRQIHRFKQAF